jgi:hypothetical protein
MEKGNTMKLCIADPPYLGRASEWYGERGKTTVARNKGISYRPADFHGDAEKWDDLETHVELVNSLVEKYDGWAIAMAHDNLRDYLPIIPRKTPVRIGIWVKQPLPGAARVINAYEPVLVRIPEGRRSSIGKQGLNVKDAVSIARQSVGFTGAKPPAWTRWVLDMLGYDAETDTVDDLFEGSGAVAQELAQGVLL